MAIICYTCMYSFLKEIEYELYASKKFFPQGAQKGL